MTTASEPRLDGAWVVASGKGGSGTSTVAGLVSYAASEAGASILLVDGDLQFGVQHLLFGLAAGRGLAALRGGGADPLSLPVQVAEGLMVLRGGPDGDQPPPVGAELDATFRRISPLLRSFGACVIDAGSRYATVSAALRAGGDRLLVVTRPDRISIAAAYALVKHTWERSPELPIHVAVNATESTEAHVAFKAIATACDRFLDRPPVFAGTIPDDQRLGERLDAGRPLHDGEPEGAAYEAARFLEKRIKTRAATRTGPGVAWRM
ncbi:MAG: hypothetical protein MJB57_07165 [Gemmatimonadetes bacterium]|nr:hypothetical protein [Gemmatimonadota bacterium]